MPDDAHGECLTLSTQDGHLLGVCTWGDAGGAPVFWLHGTPGSRFLRHPGRGYAERHLLVITYDRPGYGVSTPRPGRTVAAAAGDVLAIARGLSLTEFAVAGVSGGGPHALAAAALLPGRVMRCAAVVAPAPFAADGLDFYGGMDAEERTTWERASQGEDALVDDYVELVEWLESGMPGVDLASDTTAMLKAAFREALRPGPRGYIDDNLSLVRDWGFSLAAIRAPVRLLAGAEDTAVPPSHATWLEEHVPAAEVTWLPGGHFGPRDEAEKELLTWLGHGE